MIQKTNISKDIRQSIKALIEEARRISADVAEVVEEILQQGKENPLAPDEASVLLTKVINVLKHSASKRGDETASKSLEGDINQIVEQMIQIRDQVMGDTIEASTQVKKLELVAYNGITSEPVLPTPCFQGKSIPMYSGFVKTIDVHLWDENDRLDTHLGQFRQKNGRDPNPEELLDIMLSKMELPGIPDDKKDDQFEIIQLARSIAVNGVRKPPILDIDGTLLDGNRRIAACYYIRSSDEFDSEQKRRVEYIQVWQLTEHATDDDRKAVVVSLNFESDCKLNWPDYIKARKVYEEWEAMLTLEMRLPGRQRQAEMKRELSMKFALGPDTGTVNRYLKMVEWVVDFEDYYINEKKRDPYEVKHRADKYFQYFNELNRGGTTPGGVAFALNQDEGLKHTVFDLIYDGKLRNAQQIRSLKQTFYNQESRELLARARNESDPDLADDYIEDAITIARSQRAETREMGANTRIESFVKWLEEVPPRAFRDQIAPENLQGLVRALKLVEPMVAEILREKGVEV
ncbi:MAG: hypothetical protein SAK29_13085 [Scytonema sp. PMC 1069.18]|nr:hypothetical protein [Scytonema sp. PMC 1069.18]MEC4880944.1 hypothetical protein [Scytonema sp. PMC 1070.18]